jgi:release factor glutamine methyltransferase
VTIPFGVAPTIPPFGELQRLDPPRIAAALSMPLAEARREVDVLLTRASNLTLANVIAHPEMGPDPRAYLVYSGWLERRLRGEPVAYLLGYREFYGLTFKVSPAVLIPRPETELLVGLALERFAEGRAASVLDLGTGSGCIAITFAKLRPLARVVAVDISPEALAVAKENAAQHGVGHIEFQEGSWFAPVVGRRFDLVVSNPPYVGESDPHMREGDLRFEPRAALAAGSDGLEMLRNIIAHAAHHLCATGTLLLEHGYNQAVDVRSLLERQGFVDVATHDDLGGIPRVSLGRWLTLTS